MIKFLCLFYFQMQRYKKINKLSKYFLEKMKKNLKIIKNAKCLTLE